MDRMGPRLKMNMTKKVADKTNLYMLGLPYGLPVKFVGNGSVQRNTQKDFLESNLDAFGGNSGSPTFNFYKKAERSPFSIHFFSMAYFQNKNK
jgi:V8-like Glu-specific endopeptidase